MVHFTQALRNIIQTNSCFYIVSLSFSVFDCLRLYVGLGVRSVIIEVDPSEERDKQQKASNTPLTVIFNSNGINSHHRPVKPLLSCDVHSLLRNAS